MKVLFVLYILLLWDNYLCYSQGLEFNTNETEQSPKTSLLLSDVNKLLDCEDFLSVQYDLAIHNYASFGYILRFQNSKETAETYSFVFSYDNDVQSYLKFNIETKQCLVTDTLSNATLGSKHWLPIKIDFFLNTDSIHINIGEKDYSINQIGLSSGSISDLLFGSSRFGEEIPSFAIRNLYLSGQQNRLQIPLNENEGNNVHAGDGGIIGEVVNPIWLIGQSYHWNLLYSCSFNTTAGYNYDRINNQFLFFDKDSLLLFSLRNQVGKKVYYAGTHDMNLYLGTNFFNEKDSALYIYEVGNTEGITMSSVSLSTYQCQPISMKGLDFQRHHHSACFNVQAQKYYIFGGFGNRKYTNTLHVYDLLTDTWSVIPLKGDFIAPRFFSSMGYLNTNELLLFGGTGNETGDQSVGKKFYYDLYRINLADSTVSLIRKYASKEENVPVRNLIVSDDKTAFYTLCYPLQQAQSYLRLYKYSLSSGLYEVLGDSIPIESQSILSNSNLYFNVVTNEFYCCTQEFDKHGGNSSVIKLYSLAAPAVNIKALNIYDTSDMSLYEWIIMILCCVVGIVLCYYGIKKGRNRRSVNVMQKNQSGEKSEHTDTVPQTNAQTNAIYLLGNFQVIDKNGKDITVLFSSKVKQLFLIIFIHSVQKKQGISSSFIYGTLWPDKEQSNAKNLKGVTLNKLRKLLGDLDGISLVYQDNLYSMEISEGLFCDYYVCYRILEEIRQGKFSDYNILNLISLLKRGKLLQSFDEAIFDSLKSSFEDELYDLMKVELEYSYLKAEYEQTVRLADVVFLLDPCNDTALWYMLNALCRLKKEELAMEKYYSFIGEYKKDMKIEYGYTYTDLIHLDLRKNFD